MNTMKLHFSTKNTVAVGTSPIQRRKLHTQINRQKYRQTEKEHCSTACCENAQYTHVSEGKAATTKYIHGEIYQANRRRQAKLQSVGCLTFQQHAGVSQGQICSDKFTCCHIEIELADQTFYLTQSRYTDTGPTSPGADPIMPSAWQCSHWSAIF